MEPCRLFTGRSGKSCWRTPARRSHVHSHQRSADSLSKPAMNRVDTSGSRCLSSSGPPAGNTGDVSAWPSAWSAGAFEIHCLPGGCLPDGHTAGPCCATECETNLYQPWGTCASKYTWTMLLLSSVAMPVSGLSCLRTRLGVLDIQEVGGDAGLWGALLVHAIHQALHDAVKALCDGLALTHILCTHSRASLYHPELHCTCGAMNTTT